MAKGTAKVPYIISFYLEEEKQIWYIGKKTIVFGDELELHKLQSQLLYY